MIVTGGNVITVDGLEKFSKFVELIYPNGRTCSLPDLPEGRDTHSQTGLVICGGELPYRVDDKEHTSCFTFRAGAWVRSHTLAGQGRLWHSSWASPLGPILFGGLWKDTRKTTELLSSSSQNTKKLFNLPYEVQ